MLFCSSNLKDEMAPHVPAQKEALSEEKADCQVTYDMCIQWRHIPGDLYALSSVSALQRVRKGHAKLRTGMWGLEGVSHEFNSFLF